MTLTATRQAPGKASFVAGDWRGTTQPCIGAGFGLMEAKVVLARLLQGFDLTLVEPHVHPHMGATLEPRPGVLMRVQGRSF